MHSTEASTKLALFDWDRTIHDGFTIRTWLTFLYQEGFVAASAISELDKLFAAFADGTISYDDLCVQNAALYTATLVGCNMAEIAASAVRFVRTDKQQLFPFASRIFQLLHERGLKCIVISGAPLVVLSAHAAYHPIAHIYGLDIEADSSGRITGLVRSNPCRASEKVAIVRSLAAQARIVLACGDSPADIPLLEAAEVSIVVNTNPKVFRNLTTAAPLFWTADAIGDRLQSILDHVLA